MKKNILGALALSVIMATNSLAEVSFEHIRNATSKLNYGGTTILVDPFLAPKGYYPGFEGTFNSELRNPLIELPSSIENILKNVDAVIVTHTHLDHWDDFAIENLEKSLPIFVQNSDDQKLIQEKGFTDVRIINENTKFKNLSLTKINGAHGTIEMYSVPALAKMAGDAMGFIIQADNEKTTYFMGDTIWTADIYKALYKYNPDVLVMNTGYARLTGFDKSIIMGTDDIELARKTMPNSKIIAVHMDAVNHATISRKDVNSLIKKKNLKNVFAPKDGEFIKY